MADKDDTSKIRPARNQTEQAAPAAGLGSPPAQPVRSRLEEAIDTERQKLLQANAVLKCLYQVLLHADNENAVTYAEAAQVAITLVEESVERLDSTHVKPLIRALKGGGRYEPQEEGRKLDFDGNDVVREPRATYRWQ